MVTARWLGSSRRMAALLLSFSIALTACRNPSSAQGGAAPRTAPSGRHSQPTTAPPATRSLASTVPVCSNLSALGRWATRRLAYLTLAVPVEETDLAGALGEARAGAGGLLLFGSSAPSDLGAELRRLEAATPGHLGMLVMTDEEGGGVERMANLVGHLPWPRWMGSHWSAVQIEAAVTAMGRRMHAAGVLMDLAPVVDVDARNIPPGATDPDGWRSFSGATSVVTRDSLAYMKGLLAAGELPVLKHFPGLGGASGNTDVMAAHTLPWAILEKVALPPFEAGIAAGAPAVMVSNATVPGLSQYPASLSPAVISHELVQRLHFKGLVLTDSLSATAISAAGFSAPAAAVQALRAGADMVLFSLQASPAATRSLAGRVAAAVVAAVDDHTLGRARLVAAAAAVLRARHVSLCG